jgi:hypothetical protein
VCAVICRWKPKVLRNYHIRNALITNAIFDYLLSGDSVLGSRPQIALNSYVETANCQHNKLFYTHSQHDLDASMTLCRCRSRFNAAAN